MGFCKTQTPQMAWHRASSHCALSVCPAFQVQETDILYMFMGDLDSWESMAVDVRSPLSTVIDSGVCHPCAVLAPISDPAPLLQTCAAQAFGGLNRANLASLSKFLGLRAPSSASLFDLLLLLIRHALPHLDEDEMLRIIETRVHQVDGIAEFLLTDETDNLVIEAGQQEMTKFKKAALRDDEENRALGDGLRKMRAEFAKKQAPAPKAGARAQRKDAATKKQSRVAPPMIDKVDGLPRGSIPCFCWSCPVALRLSFLFVVMRPEWRVIILGGGT